MPVERTYLDHNATSPLRPEARAAMLEAMELVGNPSSVHAEGRAAKALMERARRQVASLVGAKPEQVVFTSGGTEANATALARDAYGVVTLDRDMMVGDRKMTDSDYVSVCAISAMEHDSVRAAGRFASTDIDEVIVVPVARHGQVTREGFGSALDAVLDLDKEPDESAAGQRFLASVLSANNETGVLQDITELARETHARHGTFHTDAVQVAGKSAYSFEQCAADLATISAHKFGGPKGAGALLARGMKRILDDPLLRGGGQEKGARAGTENLIGIAGFGAAAEAAERDLDDFTKRAEWRDEIESAVAAQTSDAVVIAQFSPRLPNTSCIALPGVPAETLVMALDLEGVAVSAGSACSSGKVTRSHVLEAMGLPDELTGSAIRVSLGWNSSKKDVDHFIRAWATVTDRLTRGKTSA